MRISTFIFLFTFLYLSSIGQKFISTRELENIADKYGADSALKIIDPLIEISEIDTSAAPIQVCLPSNDLSSIVIANKMFVFEQYLHLKSL